MRQQLTNILRTKQKVVVGMAIAGDSLGNQEFIVESVSKDTVTLLNLTTGNYEIIYLGNASFELHHDSISVQQKDDDVVMTFTL